MAELSEFLSAGFRVTREVARPSYVSAELLPDRIVSASDCMAPFAPDTWCIEWTPDSPERRMEDAQAFDLDTETLAELTGWATPRINETVRWPNVLTDLSTARELIDRFFCGLRDVRLIELGLHRSLLKRFFREAEPPPRENGFAQVGRQGVHELLLEGEQPKPAGKILGFEPLVFNYSLSCTWLCNSLEKDVHLAVGIRPNRHGLIERFEDALECVRYISSEGVGAEPGLWLPWQIIDHT